MSDFFQNGTITTLHNLGDRPVTQLEADLKGFSNQGSPMALVLPSLYSELSREALANIVTELTHVDYLEEIIIGLDRANADEFAHGR